jgi:putative transposase
VQLDTSIVVPGHVHGVMEPAPTTAPVIKRHGLPEIVRVFKSFSAPRINEMRHTAGASFWQRGYYEHIVRDERELDAIRRYIVNNPLKWTLDQDNPENEPR